MAFEGIEHPITAATVRFAPGQRAKYVPNHRSMRAFLKSDQMRDVTEDVARDIATAAGLGTPASKTGAKTHTGLHAAVKGGFKVKRNAGLMKIDGNLRVRVDVVNDVDGAALVEFGARGLKRRRMLARAGAKFGDFKPEGGPE